MKRISAMLLLLYLAGLAACGSDPTLDGGVYGGAQPGAQDANDSALYSELVTFPEQDPPLSAAPDPGSSAGMGTADAFGKQDGGIQGDDWLVTDGNSILDSDGRPVWITGLSWFGYNTGTNTFDGLWSANLEASLQSIADRGFNMLRIPFSVELILLWSQEKYPEANYNPEVNPELLGKNSLEIFDYALSVCSKAGLKVMLDIHSVHSDPDGHNYALWYNDAITVNDYYSALEWVAQRYKDDDTILAIDIKNEPHGLPWEEANAVWNDSLSQDNWRYVAETAAGRVLNKNPNVLVVIQGVEAYPKDISSNGDYTSDDSNDYYYSWWGGNLRGVRDYPIDLGEYQNKLVYSPHDYGPEVHRQPWLHEGFTFETLYAECWKDNWMFIHEQSIAPLIIGEWGGNMTQPNLQWMTYLRELIEKNRLNHFFWCFNSNSGDTGGLVREDFTSWEEEKYAFVKKVLWQEDGMFVGLDHAVPLGRNGKPLGG